MFEQSQAVAVGQHYVQQDAVVAITGYLVICLAEVARSLYNVTLAVQSSAYNLAQGTVIFYNQYFHSLYLQCLWCKIVAQS